MLHGICTTDVSGQADRLQTSDACENYLFPPKRKLPHKNGGTWITEMSEERKRTNHLIFIRHAESQHNLERSLSHYKPRDLRKFIGETNPWVRLKNDRIKQRELLALLEQEAKICKHALRSKSFQQRDPTLTIRGTVQALELPTHPYLKHLTLAARQQILVLISPTLRTLLTAEHLVQNFQNTFGTKNVLSLVIPSLTEKGASYSPSSGLTLEQRKVRFPLFDFSFLEMEVKHDKQQIFSTTGARKMENEFNDKDFYIKRVTTVACWLQRLIGNELINFQYIFVVSHGEFLNDIVKEIVGIDPSTVGLMFMHRNTSLTHLTFTFSSVPSVPFPLSNSSLSPKLGSEPETEQKRRLLWGPKLGDICTWPLDKLRNVWGWKGNGKREVIVQTLCALHRI